MHAHALRAAILGAAIVWTGILAMMAMTRLLVGA
jgi:hypothetical protein